MIEFWFWFAVEEPISSFILASSVLLHLGHLRFSLLQMNEMSSWNKTYILFSVLLSSHVIDFDNGGGVQMDLSLVLIPIGNREKYSRYQLTSAVGLCFILSCWHLKTPGVVGWQVCVTLNPTTPQTLPFSCYSHNRNQPLKNPKSDVAFFSSSFTQIPPAIPVHSLILSHVLHEVCYMTHLILPLFYLHYSPCLSGVLRCRRTQAHLSDCLAPVSKCFHLLM